MLKPKYLLVLLGIPIGYFVVLFIHIAPVATGISGYTASVKGATNDFDSVNFAAKVDRVIADLDVPVVKQLLGSVGLDVSPIRQEIQSILQAGPTLAGGDGPKKYLVSFQNSAEARGTGGILGAFAILEMDKGQFKVLQTGSNAALYSMSISTLPIDMPPEFLRLY